MDRARWLAPPPQVGRGHLVWRRFSQNEAVCDKLFIVSALAFRALGLDKLIAKLRSIKIIFKV